MSVEVRPVALNRKELKKFVEFGISLYEGNECYVPPLVSDEVDSLLPSVNPAFDFCEARAFMAFVHNRPAGRILAIINKQVNERSGRKEARFGFIDFIDDKRVSKALLQAAEMWARERGMDEMIGPMGFTDMDHEGMLVGGFDEMGTMATIYNYAYYPAHLEENGYVPDADWVEFRVEVPREVPEKMKRIAELVSRKYGLRPIKFTSRTKLKNTYGKALFELINEAYDKLYGYSPLTDRQIDYYIKEYLGMLRLDCLSVIVDKDDRLVAAGITMPSLSGALQRSHGKLLPMGWYHLLKAINSKNEVVDLLLIAVKKEYMNKGVNALIFDDLIHVFNANGFKYCESNPELETNESVQLQWQYFNHRQHRRRRAFRKKL